MSLPIEIAQLHAIEGLPALHEQEPNSPPAHRIMDAWEWLGLRRPPPPPPPPPPAEPLLNALERPR